MANILCIDDEDDFRLDLVEYLEELGHKVEQAGDGAQGLTMIECERPDLVICDRSMPKLSGIELLQAIREKYPEMPFVFLTALDDPRDRKATSHLRPSAYVTKPVDFDDFAKLLGGILTERAEHAA